ncbi:MAG: hypothetical protein AB7U75_09435 [Hyphomicrobiaceae bacterium]
MQFKALPTVTVIKKEEKEAKLKAFIADHFARRDGAASGHASDRVYLLVARSHESPVVRAIAGAIAESGATDIALKALVLVPGSHPGNTWPANLAEMTDVRTSGDIRLLDAHEQLWLDAETVWIGDCMRREPSKRDAYECYAYGCEATANSVEAAFNRLWDKGHAIVIEADEISPAEAAAVDPHLAHVTQSEPVAPTASTRH